MLSKAKLLEIDGHGSGFDSDKLDGKEGSEYALASQVSHQNLITNWDFRYPVNQGAIATLVGGITGTLSVDRWMASRGTLIVTASGLSFCWDGVNGADGVLYQNIEAYKLDMYRTKEITISVIIGGVLYIVTETIPANPVSGGTTFISTLVVAGVTITMSYFSGGAVPFYRLNIRTTYLSGSPLVIERVKLEKGNMSTLLNDEPMYLENEYPKCLRYYQKYSYRVDGTYLVTANNLYFAIPYLIIPRVTPTITIVGTPTLYYGDAGAITGITSFAGTALTSTQFYLNVAKTAHGYTGATGKLIWGDISIIVDSGLY